MHELGIVRNVVAICSERANGARVRRARLQIGRSAGVMAQSVRFCFDICAKGTVIEGRRWKSTSPRGTSC